MILLTDDAHISRSPQRGDTRQRASSLALLGLGLPLLIVLLLIALLVPLIPGKFLSSFIFIFPLLISRLLLGKFLGFFCCFCCLPLLLGLLTLVFFTRFLFILILFSELRGQFSQRLILPVVTKLLSSR